MIDIFIRPDAGHPWDGRKGFDIAEYECDTMDESVELVQNMAAEFWHPWLIHGTAPCGKKYGGALYRPVGVTEQWVDEPNNPYPGMKF